MRCLELSLAQSLEQAYAHHIQRLMVIGNFSLLAGLHPRQVHEWYLGVYIDAFEWVELPNTLGMSQFTDGGMLATKPYVSSAAYIDRQGDYCKGCYYDKKKREGERACPFNALYWDFFDRHRAKLSDNFRLAMVYRNLDKMDEQALNALRAQANKTRSQLESL
jgi:deoxyribodipyrimidine photolyase-related protein